MPGLMCCGSAQALRRCAGRQGSAPSRSIRQAPNGDPSQRLTRPRRSVACTPRKWPPTRGRPVSWLGSRSKGGKPAPPVWCLPHDPSKGGGKGAGAETSRLAPHRFGAPRRSGLGRRAIWAWSAGPVGADRWHGTEAHHRACSGAGRAWQAVALRPSCGVCGVSAACRCRSGRGSVPARHPRRCQQDRISPHRTTRGGRFSPHLCNRSKVGPARPCAARNSR